VIRCTLAEQVRDGNNPRRDESNVALAIPAIAGARALQAVRRESRIGVEKAPMTALKSLPS